MYHKAIETKQDAIDYLRKGDPAELLTRLEELSVMIDGSSSTTNKNDE